MRLRFQYAMLAGAVVALGAGAAQAQSCSGYAPALTGGTIPAASTGAPVTIDLPTNLCHDPVSIPLSSLIPSAPTIYDPSGLQGSGPSQYFAVLPSSTNGGASYNVQNAAVLIDTGLPYKSMAITLGDFQPTSEIVFIGTDKGSSFSEAITGSELSSFTKLGQSLIASGAGDVVDFSFNGASVSEVLFYSGVSANGAGLTFDKLSAATAPEPSTWALMLIGVGGLGVALRRRGLPAGVLA